MTLKHRLIKQTPFEDGGCHYVVSTILDADRSKNLERPSFVTVVFLSNKDQRLLYVLDRSERLAFNEETAVQNHDAYLKRFDYNLHKSLKSDYRTTLAHERALKAA
jgi:hypothetical protein